MPKLALPNWSFEERKFQTRKSVLWIILPEKNKEKKQVAERQHYQIKCSQHMLENNGKVLAVSKSKSFQFIFLPVDEIPRLNYQCPFCTSDTLFNHEMNNRSSYWKYFTFQLLYDMPCFLLMSFYFNVSPATELRWDSPSSDQASRGLWDLPSHVASIDKNDGLM